MKKLLPKRPLGRTKLNCSVLSLGGAQFAQLDEEITTQIIQSALENGINLIDTSPLYGNGESERKIGLALDKWYQNGGSRSDFILCTKTGTRDRPYNYSAEATKRSIYQSIKSLKTEYLDIVHIHDPENLSDALKSNGALSALQELKKEGIVHHIGLGVRNHDLHLEFHETNQCEVSLTYRDYNLLNNSADLRLLPSAKKYNVGVINAQVVRHGLLSTTNPNEIKLKWSRVPGFKFGEISHIKNTEVEKASELWEWCLERNTNLMSLNFRYCLNHPTISTLLLGMSSPKEVIENISAIITPVEESLMQELEKDFTLP